MKKLNKKGFTIVELVIVIAVIAILAAVLIPTFGNIVQQARISADTQLLRNLNTALKVDNKQHHTMTEALQAAENSGYLVDRINASATNNEILWDSANDAFCYYNDETEQIEYVPEVEPAVELDTDSYKYWQIIKLQDTEAKSDVTGMNWSVYLASSKESALTTSTGFDAGECTNIASITYASDKEQEVVIRTNGGKLTVNAEKDSVWHYGQANSVEIKNIATSSYHECASSKFISIANGRIALEKGADVNGIHFIANEDAKSFDEIIVAVDQSVELPKFSRNPVTIEGAVLVVEVQDSTDKNTANSEYIYLYQQGVYEQFKVADNANGNNLKEVETNASDDGKIIAHQIANNISGGKTYDEVKANDGSIDTSKGSVEESGVLPDEAQETSAIKGYGTEEKPFLIYDVNDLKAISSIADQGYSFKLMEDIDATNEDWIPLCPGYYDSPEYTLLKIEGFIYFCGKFEGNNKTIKIKHNSSTANYEVDTKNGCYKSVDVSLFGTIYGGHIRNLTVDVDYNISKPNVAGAGLAYYAGGSTFDNVVVNGKINSTSSSAGLVYCAQYTQFTNCVNNSDITVTYTHTNVEQTGDALQVVGGIAGDLVSYEEPWNCIFDNCTNNGDLLNVTITDRKPRTIMGAMYGQSINTTNAPVTITNCKNTGTLSGYDKSSPNPNAYPYPMFEGNITGGGKTYVNNPNLLKQLVGGYSEAGVIIDGTLYDVTHNNEMLSRDGSSSRVMFKSGE